VTSTAPATSTTAGPTTSAPPTTAPPPAPPAPSLPADDRPRTPPVDASAELADVAPQDSFPLLADGVVAALDARFPAEEPSQASTSSSGATEEAGTVLFRVDGLADDSVAGWDYTVAVARAGDVWAVASADKVAICRRGVSGDLCS
jgi:hypothetical protein